MEKRCLLWCISYTNTMLCTQGYLAGNQTLSKIKSPSACGYFHIHGKEYMYDICIIIPQKVKFI